MKLRYLSFSAKGTELAQRLAQTLPGEVSRCNRETPLQQWTQKAFAQVQGLVFVGATGIAVRAIAPYLKSKTTDPAVVVVDECAHFAVPILSGHLGGANDLARKIAAICGAVPVLTTATDANGVFAVDEWAKRQNCRIIHPEKIKEVSASVLAGEIVRVSSPWSIIGDCPAGVEQVQDGNCDVRLDCINGSDVLQLVPQILVLGLGCRKGTAAAVLEESFRVLLTRSGVYEQAICTAASIDLKQGEPGLLDFCRAHGWPCQFYSAAQLKAVPGAFTSSEFVQNVTGVDNVCERSAVLASGGHLYWKKEHGNGVTMALAQIPYVPTWRWQDSGE